MGRLIGVPNRQADRHVKSDEPVSTETAGRDKQTNRELDEDIESGQTNKQAAYVGTGQTF